MTPLERVEAARVAVVYAQGDLRQEVRAAVAAGITVTKVAAAAGVDRGTVTRWVRA